MNDNSGIDSRVSIIVPVHNARDYIANTIKMVEAQTYTNWELILVDDASTDDSVEIITSVIEKSSFSREHFVLILKDKNEKAAAARNTGLDAAVGRYIAFLDADDVWQSEKLEKELEFMEKENASFVFCSYEFGDEYAKPTGKIVHVPDKLDFKHALSRTVIFTSTTLFDTRHLDKKLLYMPLIESEDTATWWSILKTGVIARGLDESLVIYRRPVHSLSSNKLVAIKRIWRLYREIAKLSVFSSVVNLVGWAYRATVRRIKKEKKESDEEVVIIAGLGNPEKKYFGTRHNVGFATIDALCDKYGIELTETKFNAAYGKGMIGDHKVLLMKPLTYMNKSGEAIGPMCHFYKVSPENDLIVISDDIDQDVGNIRVRPKGSAGGHNGLKSIIAHCGTDGFSRIRVGVGHKPQGMDLADHVLSHFSGEEEEHLKSAIENAVEAIPVILDEGTDIAMNRFNRKVV